MDRARRISFNHATFGWAVPFAEFVSVVAASGAGGVGVWSERMDGISPEDARTRLRDAGLSVTALNRGGFFVAASEQDRRRAVDATRRQIDFAARLGSEVLLIVPGGLSEDVRDLQRARDHVHAGLAAVMADATAAGVKLGLEPFHPALTASRGVINTCDSALDLCNRLGPSLGIVTDIYHMWWDPGAHAAIARAGPRILGHHICDWKLSPSDVATDRAVMGEGVADVVGLTRSVLQAGYAGLVEIEIFSQDDLWRRPPEDVARLCLDRAVDCLRRVEDGWADAA